MKKKIIFLLACMLMMMPGIANAAIKPGTGNPPACECAANDNLCTNCGYIKPLFTICEKSGKNCTEINTDTINNNQKYDLFEIKDKEIYLDNSEIKLEFNNIWSLLDYKVHISRTNKIVYLNNAVQNSLFSLEDYIPFTVEGDGTLEIEVANQIKTNASGEKYYKCWQLLRSNNCGNEILPKVGNNGSRSIDANEIQMLRKTVAKSGLKDPECLTEATVNANNNTVTFNVPTSGYTASDLKRIFGNNADSFYIVAREETIIAEDLGLITMLKSYANADDLLTQDSRIQFITTLINRGTDVQNGSDLACETPYLIPSQLVFEETQITPTWGEANIITTLNRSFSDTGSYLIGFPEKKDTVTTTQKDNIVFESTEEFAASYYLRVDDITEKITDVQSLSVQAKTDKVLVELYDINMYDENDNIVKMENGTYTIKVELDDLLKKYEGYQVIYIADDNTVELIDAKVEGNYIVFNTTHLSKYGIVGSEIRKTGNIITNPKTADSVVTYGLILGALLITAGMVLFRIRKLRKEN